MAATTSPSTDPPDPVDPAAPPGPVDPAGLADPHGPVDPVDPPEPTGPAPPAHPVGAPPASVPAGVEAAGTGPRFDGVTRAVHWANAALFLFLVGTGLVLSFGPLSAAVGRRALMKDLHVWAGLALPLPILAGIAGRWGGQFKRDVAHLNRWLAEDRRWFRRRFLGAGWGSRRPAYEFGKFHPGQKLNAAFVAGSIPVMLLTGGIMRWYEPFPLEWRTGATFVHDWTATALLIVIAGHIVKALTTPGALAPMLTGGLAATGEGRRRTAGGRGPSPDGRPPA